MTQDEDGDFNAKQSKIEDEEEGFRIKKNKMKHFFFFVQRNVSGIETMCTSLDHFKEY